MTDWPDHFDFETDEKCRKIRRFIEAMMEKLEAYHARREPGAKYIFHEHSYRAADDIKNACVARGLSERVSNNMYWATLPHDIGKMLVEPPSVWDLPGRPDEEQKRMRRAHTDLGASLVHEHLADINHPFKDLMLDIMLNHHEQMDGKGYRGIPGSSLSEPVKLVIIADTFDSGHYPRGHHDKLDTTDLGVLRRMWTDKIHIFDQRLLYGFTHMKLGKQGAQQLHIPLPVPT
jgi:HD-GYP domain-containing protein (c-di-GMP phosphodiesterase class II)